MDSIEGEELSITTDGCAYGASRGVGERCIEGHWLNDYARGAENHDFRLLESFVLHELGFKSQWFTFRRRDGGGQMIMVYANICWSRKEAKESARAALGLVFDSSAERWLKHINQVGGFESFELPEWLRGAGDAV